MNSVLPWRREQKRYYAVMPATGPQHPVRRIVSGGQTGVDRGALDAAKALGIPHGGWCPAGRVAEDGRIPQKYQLKETESSDYALRTERNVLDSHASLILFRGRLSGGTELTVHLAKRHEKPCCVVDLRKQGPGREVLAWINEHQVEILNVAGPRESSNPGIAEEAKAFVKELLA